MLIYLHRDAAKEGPNRKSDLREVLGQTERPGKLMLPISRKLLRCELPGAMNTSKADKNGAAMHYEFGQLYNKSCGIINFRIYIYIYLLAHQGLTWHFSMQGLQGLLKTRVLGQALLLHAPAWCCSTHPLGCWR